MVEEKLKSKKFINAHKSIDSKYRDLQKEINEIMNDLLEKTYKQFEKTYEANSRRNEG